LAVRLTYVADAEPFWKFDGTSYHF